MATLTAGQSSSFKGFAAVGNAIGLPTFGSFDTAPFAGVTTQYIYTTDGTNGSIGLTGNQSPSFFGGQIYVDGVAWAVTYTAYDGTHTSYSLTPANGTGFVNATNYNVALTSAPVDPNITSAAAVTNLVNTTLAHTITADKTIASTAIIGGADAAGFQINGTNQLRFASNAASSALGPLVVEIEITDTDGLTDTQTITVTVKAIVYVGGKIHKRAGATSTASVSLTDLTGGIASAPAADDFVIAGYGIGSTVDRDVAITTGYTEQADIYANGTSFDANLGVFTKSMPGTPDTTLTVGSTGSVNDAGVTIIHVFRGVDLTNPMDVAVVTATGTGTGKPDPGAITPITTGAVGVFFGAQSAGTMANLTSSDLTAFRQDWQSDTVDVGVGGGFIEWTSGALNPAVFGGGASNAANSWAAVSLALRPAWTGGGTPSVTVNGAAHTQTASSPTLAAKSTVTPNSSASVHVASSPSLATKSTVSADSTAHINAATSPSLAATSTVAPDSAAHISTASSPTVGTPVAISPNSAASATASTEPTIAAKSSIAPDSTAHAHTSASPTVTTANSVAPNSAAHTQAASGPTLATNNQVAPNAAAHITASGSPTIAAQSIVAPDGVAHDTAATSPTLSVLGNVTVESAAHATVSGEPTIAAKSAVSVESAGHDTASSEPSLSSSLTISVGSAAHLIVSTSPALAWAGQIAANDSAHNVVSGSPSIFISNEVPADRHARTRPGLTAAMTTTTNRSAASDPDLRTATTSKGRRAA